MKKRLIAIAVATAMTVTCMSPAVYADDEEELPLNIDNVLAACSYYSDDSDDYKKLSDDEKETLKEAYDNAYEDESSALDLYVAEYAKSYNPNEYMAESLMGLIDNTEDFYQAVNDYDPNLKDEIAAVAGEQFGQTPIGVYGIEKGVGAVLADDEMGQELRELGANLLFGGLSALALIAGENKVRSDALYPIVVGNEYALVRTYGTVSEILNEIEIQSGYNCAMTAINDRITAIGADFDNHFNYWDWESEDYDDLKNRICALGRHDALVEKRNEWEENIYNAKHEFLTSLKTDEAQTLITRLEENRKMDNGEIANFSDEYYDEPIDASDLNRFDISGQYIYFVIDKNGDIQGAFFHGLESNGMEEVDAAINDKGECSLRPEAYGENYVSFVIDKNCNLLYKSQKTMGDYWNNPEYGEDGTIKYSNVTPSGNLLKLTYETDFDHGDYNVLYLVEPDGTCTELIRDNRITLIDPDSLVDHEIEEKDAYYSDYYRVDREEGDTVYVNVATGKIMTSKEEYLSDRGGISYDEYVSAVADGDEEKIQIYNSVRLNDQYLYYDNTIYDNDGNIVTTLEQGEGVYDIKYINGKYWVITNGGYYYTMDDDFNMISEPIRFGEDEIYSCQLTGYGLFKTDQDEQGESITNQYDEKGNVVWTIPGYVPDGVQGFLYGNKEAGWYNLETDPRELLLLTIPEDGVKVLPVMDVN